MKLVIDFGNSRLKWACAEGAALQSLPNIIPLTATDLAQALTGAWQALQKPERVVIASVTAKKYSDIVDQWVQAHWQQRPVYLEPAVEQLGVINQYQPPQSLGSDRWAALLAARHIAKRAVCVVDVGTAVTIDVLDDAGHFVGGFIFPGPWLLVSSLQHGTNGISGDALDAHAFFEHVHPLGVSTVTAIDAGAFQGLCGAVEKMIEKARTQYHFKDVLYTGGFARRLFKNIDINAREVPTLVLQGLALASEE